MSVTLLVSGRRCWAGWCWSRRGCCPSCWTCWTPAATWSSKRWPACWGTWPDTAATKTTWVRRKPHHRANDQWMMKTMTKMMLETVSTACCGPALLFMSVFKVEIHTIPVFLWPASWAAGFQTAVHAIIMVTSMLILIGWFSISVVGYFWMENHHQAAVM